MENENKLKHKVVQTYTEDMVHVLEDDRGGMIKKIIHGEEEHEKEKRNLSPESKKNQVFMIIGIFLILVSVAALAFFILKKEVITSVFVAKQPIHIIFTDKDVVVEIADLKKPEIEQKIQSEIYDAVLKTGGIQGMYLTVNKNPIGFRKFIEQIEGNLVFDNNFIDDNFLMGVVNEEAGKDFFILLKVNSVTDVFDTMHAWESKMFTDLYGFFGMTISPETKDLLTASFEDGIVANKNARILYKKNIQENNPENDQTDNPQNNTGKREIAMMYVFADDNSIIITNSEKAVQEIILRLASSEIKK